MLGRLTLVIYSLQAGGAERVLSLLANRWAAEGWAVTLITVAAGEPFYPLDPHVTRVGLGVEGASPNAVAAVANAWARVRALRRAIRLSRPDRVLSFMDTTNVLTLLATRGLGIPVVVAERSEPSLNPIGRAWDRLRALTYPRAAAVVVQTTGAARYFEGWRLRRLCVIPNSVARPPVLHEARAAAERRLVALGRLGPEKGHDMLLRAFARVAGQHPTWSLTIWGEGPMRPALEALVAELGLAQRVSLPGVTREPASRLAEADLFVMPSRFEGFPNALCEAMAAGLPCVSFDCPSGPREIVRHDVDGYLVPPEDVAGLAEALALLMQDEARRARYGAAARELSTRLSEEAVAGLWAEVLA